jgi:hypothetical protein
MELKPTDLILRRREAPSRRMAAGTISLVAVLRDARKRAPQDEVDRCGDTIRNSETQHWDMPKGVSARSRTIR